MAGVSVDCLPSADGLLAFCGFWVAVVVGGTVADVCRAGRLLVFRGFMVLPLHVIQCRAAWSCAGFGIGV